MTGTYHCGHDRTPENTRTKKDGKGRYYDMCRECYNANERRRGAARRRARKLDQRTPPSEPRLPSEPLFRYMRRNLIDTPHALRHDLRRAKDNGWVTVSDADQIACALGTHPGLLWAEWWLPVEECA